MIDYSYISTSPNQKAGLLVGINPLQMCALLPVDLNNSGKSISVWDFSQESLGANRELQLCLLWCVDRAVPGFSFPV